MQAGSLDYSGPIEIADGIFWVGYVDESASLHCNPYLIVDGDEAVLIDGGSRKDFSTVMLKVMRTGTNPRHIKRLIYQHYDPDLCGNIPHMEAIINSEDLKIISHRENNIFINYYSMRSPKVCIETLGYCYEFKSGRKLRFIRTPYTHSTGSFVTYDEKSQVLFSSDICGSYDNDWGLFADIHENCAYGDPTEVCAASQKRCHVYGIVDFHRRVMPSLKALRYALQRIRELDISLIAPQHGSILDTQKKQQTVLDRLEALHGIGIDGYFKEIGHE